jgi:small subunit ribosomal protein S11
MASKTTQRTAKSSKEGTAHIKATLNNIIVTITNDKQQPIAWSSAGKMRFKGAKKQTTYAAQKTAEDCAKNAHNQGMEEVKVRVKGIGKGKEAAIRAIGQIMQVTEIRDITPIPHGGCRPPKIRKF